MLNDFDPDASPSAAEVIPVVVGAHLRAEVAHRAPANVIASAIDAWTAARSDLADPARALVCTDLWYLNDDALRRRPTICVGDPEANAATACLAHRLPPVLEVDDRYRIHLDLDRIDLQCCVWGANASATATAAEVFVARYLDAFLRASHLLPL